MTDYLSFALEKVKYSTDAHPKLVKYNAKFETETECS